MAQVESQLIDQPIAGAMQASHTNARFVTRRPGEDVGMGPQDSFAELDQELREGDQDAAAKVFRRFTKRLIGLARTRLDARIRRKEGPAEVVQSVYRSFFTRYHSRQFDFETWDALWSLLTKITVRKCRSRAEYYRAQRRDITREVDAVPACDAAEGADHAIDREPTPLEALILGETVELVMRGLEADDRTNIELSLQGRTAQDISTQLALSERTVGRVRERIKIRLLRIQADGNHTA
jgi:RNA polymerase sigma-70 factor, ECF subfamily